MSGFTDEMKAGLEYDVRITKPGQGGDVLVEPASVRAVLAEVARLNKWADGYEDAMLKERRTAEEHIRELRSSAEKAEAALKDALDSKSLRPMTLAEAGQWSRLLERAEKAEGNAERLCTENNRFVQERNGWFKAVKKAETERDKLRDELTKHEEHATAAGKVLAKRDATITKLKELALDGQYREYYGQDFCRSCDKTKRYGCTDDCEIEALKK